METHENPYKSGKCEHSQQVINLAKALASEQGQTQLDAADVLKALVLFHTQADKSEWVAAALKQALDSEAEIQWPPELTEFQESHEDDLAQLEEKAAELSEEPFKLQGALNAGVKAALERDKSLPLAILLEELFQGKPKDSLVKTFLKLNSFSHQKNGRSLVDSERQIRRKLAAFKGVLREELPGQKGAIDMLAHSYEVHCRIPPSRGPFGPITVLGPYAAGMDRVGTALAAALSKAEGTEHSYCNVRQDDLDSFEGSAKAGVLLFDKIESADEGVQSTISAALASGKLGDANMRKSWTVFTTDLGKSFFTSANESGILRTANFHKAELFDILSSEKADSPFDSDGLALDPRLVNQMRSGGVAVLSKLDATDFFELMDKKLQEIHEDEASVLPRIELKDEAKLMVLLNAIPSVTPHQVIAATRDFAAQLASDVLGKFEEEVGQAKKTTIKVQLDEESQSWLEQHTGNKVLRILLFDDDDRMEKFIQDNFSDWDLQVKRVQRLEDIGAFRPDLVMLDLDTRDDKDKKCAMEVHRSIREGMPGMPLFLFSEEETVKEQIHAIASQGGARGFFAFSSSSDKPVNISDQEVTKFRCLLRNFQYDNCLEKLLGQSRHVTFSVRHQATEIENGEFVVRTSLHSAGEEAITRSSDGPVGAASYPDINFDNVFGLDRAKERLRMAAEMIMRPVNLQLMKVRPPTGYLLAGPPGTGKTFLARAFAGHAKIPFYQLGAGELISKWVGEGEERIRDLFYNARKYAPSIIFIDEIDSIASKRGGSGDGQDYTEKLLNQLLTCMDGFKKDEKFVFVLAATNRVDLLDPAIRRPGRFDETIPVELPGPEARCQMMFRLLPGMFSDIHDNKLARLVARTAGMSPAEIDRIIREAAYIAIKRDDNQVSHEDLEAACKLVKYGAEKEDHEMCEEERCRTAWHEAGHAIAMCELFPDAKLDYVSIVPTEEGALGFVATNMDEQRNCMSRPDIINRIAVCLAGRVAEKMAPGLPVEDAVNSGASSDLRRATQLAYGAVTSLGMSEEFGEVSVEGLPQWIAIAHEMGGNSRMQIDFFIDSGREKAVEILTQKKEMLQGLAELLLKEDSLDGADVQKLITGVEKTPSVGAMEKPSPKSEPNETGDGSLPVGTPDKPQPESEPDETQIGSNGSDDPEDREAAQASPFEVESTA